MSQVRGIAAIVFDVLGTLVDESLGIRKAIRGAVPDADDTMADELLAVWQRHVTNAQQDIEQGRRSYINSDAIDREAAQLVADRAGINDPSRLARLATASRALPAWSDSVASLQRIARQFPVIALSNASHATLLHLSAQAGLSWHLALSGEAVRAYKPAPEVYQLAVDATGYPADHVLMVAAHAWDLRSAHAKGMRTAYVHRPVGEPPRDGDSFDGQFNDLADMAAALHY